MKKDRRILPMLCASALAAAIGCSPDLPREPVDDPGSRPAASPAPKDLPKGVKQGPGQTLIR